MFQSWSIGFLTVFGFNLEFSSKEKCWVRFAVADGRLVSFFALIEKSLVCFFVFFEKGEESGLDLFFFIIYFIIDNILKLN